MNPQLRTFLLGIFTTLLIFLFITKSCDKAQTIDYSGTLKIEVKELKHKSDSVKINIVYRDSIRTKTLIKYKEVRHDSLIPCETKLIICDTLLVTDSALISEYVTKSMFDSSIISTQARIMRNDSATIAKLSHKLVKSKRRGKMMFGAGFILGVGVGSFRR